MAVRLRLTRKGRKKSPFYRVVAIDSRKPREGRALEVLGFYDPTKNPVFVDLDKEKIQYWLSVGAQPSRVVSRLMASVGLGKAEKVVSSQQKVAKKDRKKSDDSE